MHIVKGRTIVVVKSIFTVKPGDIVIQFKYSHI